MFRLGGGGLHGESLLGLLNRGLLGLLGWGLGGRLGGVTSQKVVLGYSIISSIKLIVKRLKNSKYVDFYYEIHSPDSSHLRISNGVLVDSIAPFQAEL